jgi:hypothetical protein
MRPSDFPSTRSRLLWPTAGAAEAFHKHLQLAGKDGGANYEAWFFATCLDPAQRDPREALSLAYLICAEAGWQAPNERDTLAAACAAAGDFPAAIANQESAIALERSAKMRVAMEARLALYRQHRGYFAPP